MTRVFALPVLLAPLVLTACGPAVTLSRVVPPTYYLGPVSQLVLVEARGTRSQVSDFTRALSSEVNGSGLLRMADGTGTGARLSAVRAGASPSDAASFRRQRPADVYVGAVLSCDSTQQSETYREKDSRGVPVTRRRYWADARCEAHLDMVDGRDGRELAAFEASGQGSSSRVDYWSTTKAEEALDQAAVAAAKEAAALFIPRQVTERVYLEKEAPAAAAGIERIKAGQYAEARALWEQALQREPQSAPLNYNLGAVTEALGDVTAARAYYQRAIAFAPNQATYREALGRLEQRVRDAEALRRRR